MTRGPERSCILCDRPLTPEQNFEMLIGYLSFDDQAEKLGCSKAMIPKHLDHMEIDRRAFRLWAKDHRCDEATKAEVALKLTDLMEAQAPTEGMLYARFYFLEGKAIEILQALEDRGDHRGSIDAIKAAEMLVRRCAELAGFLSKQEPTTVVILAQSPEYLAIQQAVVLALAPYPDAAIAAAKALAIDV